MLKKILKFAGLGVAILAIVSGLYWRGIFMGIQRGLQNQFYDHDRASSQMVVMAIDEKSLKPEALGPLGSWNRSNYADAIRILNEAGAKAIGLDITLPDEREGDDVLAETLSANKNVVLAARYYFENGRREFESPNEVIQTSEPTLGWINVKQDEDGFVRELPVFSKKGEEVIEAFALAVSRIAEQAEPVEFWINQGEYPFAPGVRIPVKVERDGEEEVPLMQINYFGAPNTFQQISFADVLAGHGVDKRGNPVDFKDKIILIGPTAIDLQDHYLAPTSAGVKMAGVEIHANAIQTVLERAFLRNQSARSLWIMLIGLLAINLAIFAWLKVRYALPIALVEMAGLVVAGIVVYELRIFMNVVYPILTVLLSFVGAFLLRFILEQKERKFIEGAFGHYVNSSVVKQIIAHPEMLELGGAKRQITVFFSDIAGFTTVSEKMKPEELVKFLNEYLQEMTEIILAHQGTLDKYEGDAIMAFWNAPLAQHDHAKQACLAALQNQAKLKELRKKWAKEGHAELHVRVGLNTGDAVVGNMGSRDRFDYTAIGDNVNLASRLEGINKQYGTEIMVSESTYEAAKDDFEFRELDLIRVKGKEKPVRIYELNQKTENGKQSASGGAEYAKALQLYRERKFEEARQKFASLKDDPTAQVFTKRCEEFIKNPPPQDWGGVWTFQEK